MRQLIDSQQTHKHLKARWMLHFRSVLGFQFDHFIWMNEFNMLNWDYIEAKKILSFKKMSFHCEWMATSNSVLPPPEIQFLFLFSMSLPLLNLCIISYEQLHKLIMDAVGGSKAKKRKFIPLILIQQIFCINSKFCDSGIRFIESNCKYVDRGEREKQITRKWWKWIKQFHFIEFRLKRFQREWYKLVWFDGWFSRNFMVSAIVSDYKWPPLDAWHFLASINWTKLMHQSFSKVSEASKLFPFICHFDKEKK